ncbi:dihydroneopterin aldolase [Poseidonibacter parvus]|uniref:Dihydroneopterin aldolase n=1 Tax=Poseidonibacter parvus TaxID=1850254 RepID=A0A1P8KJG3_9BACT|nr:dihydroneopterin aldolase [Poseidonibacter parvus]APW64675.1 dihydroneopterin aldolase [Poseidonibacter parvus]
MKVEINDLSFKCIIGILDFERVKKQKVIVNLSFEYEFKEDFFIDYSEISAFVEKQMKKRKFLLIEDAIIFLEAKLYKLYKINNLIISISKPNILKNCIVSVSN